MDKSTAPKWCVVKRFRSYRVTAIIIDFLPLSKWYIKEPRRTFPFLWQLVSFSTLSVVTPNRFDAAICPRTGWRSTTSK